MTTTKAPETVQADRAARPARREFMAMAAATAAGALGLTRPAAAEEGSGAGAPTVLVTGANRGIGLEFVRQYAARGWRVIATCRDPAAALELADLAAASDLVVVEKLDVLDHPGIDRLAAKYEGAAVDILLNNAGISGGAENQTFGRLNYDVFPDVMAVNVMGAMKMCEAFLPHVERSGFRRMMTVSSGQGSIGKVTMPMLYWYRASKAALNMAMYNLSLALKGRGIIVGLVTPGPTDTDMMDGLPKKMLRPVGEAVADMVRNIDAFTLERTGEFVDVQGRRNPW